jgi:DNA uptake protein ComE-like DNA-binding protein
MNEFFANLGRLFLGAVVIAAGLLSLPPGWTTAWLGMSVGVFSVVAIVALAAFLTLKNQEERLQAVSDRVSESQKLGSQSSGSTRTSEADRRKIAPSNRVLNINSANETAISKLSFLRASVAEKIVLERTIKPFTSLDELTERCGLKPHEAERLKHLVVFRDEEENHRPSIWERFLKNSEKSEKDFGSAGQDSAGDSGRRPKGRIVDY